MAAVTMLGMDAWTAKVKRMIPAAEAALKEHTKVAAEEFKAGFLRAVPVLTGDLKHSLRVEAVNEYKFKIAIGDKDNPARKVEFGHNSSKLKIHIHGTPFWYPTIRTAGKRIRQKMRRNIRKALKAAWYGALLSQS